MLLSRRPPERRAARDSGATGGIYDPSRPNLVPRLSEHAQGRGAFDVSQLQPGEVLELEANVMPSTAVGDHEESAIQYAQEPPRRLLKGQCEWSGLAPDATGVVYDIHAKNAQDEKRAKEIMYPKAQGAKAKPVRVGQERRAAA